MAFFFSFFNIQGSRDNMSIVLVCFSNAPKVSDEAVKKDSELDKHLESRVEGKNIFLIDKEMKRILPCLSDDSF
jgi:hypothetical protein